MVWLRHNFLWIRNKWSANDGTGLIVAFFFAAAVLVFAPAIYRPSIFQVFGGDVYHNLWIWGRNVSNVVAGTAPYAPNIFFPDPLSSFYSEMEIGHSILYGLLSAVRVHPIQSYMVIVVLSFALTGILVALISRRLGASTTGAIVGGAIAAFAGYRYNHLSHVQLLAVYWMLIPLYFSLSYLLEGKRRHLVLTAIAHIPVLCGPSYNLIGLIMLEAGISLAFALDGTIDKGRRWRRAGFLVFAVMAAGLLTVPFWAGYFELFRNGFARDRNNLVAHGMDLSSLLTPPDGNLIHGYVLNWIKAKGQQNLSINSAFVGFAALSLLILALFRRLSLPEKGKSNEGSRYLPFLRAIKWTGIAMLALSLGDVVAWHELYVLPNPIFKVGELTHLLSATRYIGHYAYLGVVAMSIIVAYWLNSIMPDHRPKTRIGLYIGLAIIVILENVSIYVTDVARLPSKLVSVPQIYRHLAALPAGKGVVFLPLPTYPNNVDDVYRRQFEYMFNSQYHRLSMFNGISGFFPPHYTQGVNLLSEFPNLAGLNFILKNHIDYMVNDKHSGRSMDFSKEKIDSVCRALTSIYIDADYELFQVDRVRGMECVAQADKLLLAQWVFLMSKATPHQIGQFSDSSKTMIAKPDEQGALAFGPYIILDKGKYRVLFFIDAPDSGEKREIGTVDVDGYNSDANLEHIYAKSPIYTGNQKQVLQLDFEVVDPTLKHEFRVWSNGGGTIELSRISLEKM